jgi:uncharacterized protein YbcV (DUF1398 family)
VGGFPVLAEVLRQAGVRRNEWTLPIGQSLYVTDEGAVAEPGPAAITAMTEVPSFDREAVIRALRVDQAGDTTFPQFLTAIWQAGVTRFVVDTDQRAVTYSGIDGNAYIETYPPVDI